LRWCSGLPIKVSGSIRAGSGWKKESAHFDHELFF
jgi:hypothetical protein